MLAIERLGKVYPNGVNALERFSADIRLGEIVAIIGGSGCGKSTLLRAVAGLDRATTGTVTLDETAITAPHAKIGIIFQEPRLLPWLSVADNIGFGLSDLPAQARREKIAYRSGAQVSDILCATGDLGAAFMGLQVLEREKQVFLSDPNMEPNMEKYEYLVGRQLKPEARTDIVFDLEEAGVKPTSMIDISDGLASELLHIARNSGVGVRIYEDKIPIDGLAYEIKVGRLQGDSYYVRFSSSGSAPDEAKGPDEERLKKLRERLPREKLLSDHVLLVPKSKLEDTLKPRAELLEKKNDKK